MIFDDPQAGMSAGNQTTAYDFNLAGSDRRSSAAAIAQALIHLEQTISQHADMLDHGDIEDAIARLEEKSRTGLYHHLISHYQDSIEATLAALTHKDAPTIGADFIRACRKANPHFTINTRQSAQANFSAYHLKRGRIDEVSFNPDLIDMRGKPHIFAGAANHELAHLLHNNVVPALRHVPWNTSTSVLIHPLDKARLDNLCERDAYVKQALFNTLTMQANTHNPSVREMMIKDTSAQVITTEEMEYHMAAARSLREAMVNASLDCLNKPVKAWDADGRTFNNSYFDITMDDYRAGMGGRRAVTPDEHVVFVRLTTDDFLAVDSYGAGPRYMDERFTGPIRMTQEEEQKLSKLCKDYSIPLLQECPALSEVILPERKANPYINAQPETYPACAFV